MIDSEAYYPDHRGGGAGVVVKQTTDSCKMFTEVEHNFELSNDGSTESVQAYYITM